MHVVRKSWPSPNRHRTSVFSRQALRASARAATAGGAAASCLAVAMRLLCLTERVVTPRRARHRVRMVKSHLRL